MAKTDIREIRDFILGIVSENFERCDLLEDGAIYYMNGNDGTSFDYYVNGHTCEFMVFFKESEFGAVKATLEKDGTLHAYIYDKDDPCSYDKMKVELDKTKSYTEQAKDLVGVVATKKAIEDEELVDDITETKKDELRTSAEASLKEEQAKSKTAERALQEANYGVYEGVATYAGIKKPLPKGMQKVLFAILAAVQIVVLVTIGVPTSIVNIIADCIDSIIKKLSSIAKSARVLVVSLIVLGAVALLAYVVVTVLKNYNII